MSEKYNLVFSGVILPGLDQEATKEKAVRVLKIPATQKEAFFSGKEITLKKDLSLDEGLKLKGQLEQLGLMTVMVSTTMASMSFSLEKHPNEEASVTNTNHVTKQKETEIKDRRRVAREEYLARREQEQEEDYEESEEDAPKILSFSIKGRYGRLNYLNAGIISGLVALAIMIIVIVLFFRINSHYQLLSSSIFIFIFIAVINFRFGILRLHDLNLSGWYILLSVIPYVGSIFVLYLLLAPGNEGSNDYGNQPRAGSKAGLIVLAFIIIIQLSSLLLS